MRKFTVTRVVPPRSVEFRTLIGIDLSIEYYESSLGELSPTFLGHRRVGTFATYVIQFESFFDVLIKTYHQYII